MQAFVFSEFMLSDASIAMNLEELMKIAYSSKEHLKIFKEFSTDSWFEKRLRFEFPEAYQASRDPQTKHQVLSTVVEALKKEHPNMKPNFWKAIYQKNYSLNGQISKSHAFAIIEESFKQNNPCKFQQLEITAGPYGIFPIGPDKNQLVNWCTGYVISTFSTFYHLNLFAAYKWSKKGYIKGIINETGQRFPMDDGIHAVIM